MNRNIKSFMLGPKGENHQEFQSLINDIIADHVYWRRNFYPNDKPAIRHADKTNKDYLEFYDNMRDTVFNFLSRAKQNVPFASSRYLGHMNTDLLIPGLIGYIAGLLYNQNNVARESSPITSELEDLAIREYLNMVGFDSKKGSGYITSGGTAANIQALWVARNIKLWPLSLCCMLKNTQSSIIKEILIEIGLVDELVNECSCYDILRYSPDKIITIYDEVTTKTEFIKEEYHKEIDKYSLQSLGISMFFDLLKDTFPKEKHEKYLNGGIKIIAAINKHYCIPKAIEILGLGKNSLLAVNYNSEFSIDTEKYFEVTEKAIREKEIILATVSILGSTEQGSIDQIDKIKDRVRELGCWWHIDGAYGGYLFSALKNAKGEFLQSAEIKEIIRKELFVSEIEPDLNEMQNFLDLVPLDKIIKKLSAVKYSHSLALDPHKLGYIPYAAGMILFENKKSFEFVSFDAPYLWRDDPSFVGRFTVEGSRPGAAATAIYLSTSLIPLNTAGHGKIILSSMMGALSLAVHLEKDNKYDIGIHIINKYPETNILNYFIYNKHIRKLSRLKELHDRLLRYHLWPTTENKTFMVVSTELKVKDLIKYFSHHNIEIDLDENSDFPVLRSVVMSPFTVTAQNVHSQSILQEFSDYLIHAIVVEINKMMIDKLMRKIKILIIDDNPTIKEQLIDSPNFRGNNAIVFDQALNKETAISVLNNREYDLVILDINLTGKHNDEGGIELFETILKDPMHYSLKMVLFNSSYLNQNKEKIDLLISSYKSDMKINCVDKDSNQNLTKSFQERFWEYLTELTGN
ncbi:MAG: hypothetical protein HUU54_05710 [Ignavibacteriaceae bacterium]|nr:hypothetical protein [Ignavibacteriaceae bacterium]